MKAAALLLTLTLLLALSGCTRTVIMRQPPPATLTAPHDLPALKGDTNAALLDQLDATRATVDLCNEHKGLIREFYRD